MLELSLEKLKPAPRYLSAFSRNHWRESNGKYVQIAEMHTSHMFNCLRMLYDHAAKAEGWSLMRKPGEGIQASKFLPKDILAMWIGGFIKELIKRDDLHSDKRCDLIVMLQEIFGVVLMVRIWEGYFRPLQPQNVEKRLKKYKPEEEFGEDFDDSWWHQD